jgi:transcription elongation factor Elf1
VLKDGGRQCSRCNKLADVSSKVIRYAVKLAILLPSICALSTNIAHKALSIQ